MVHISNLTKIFFEQRNLDRQVHLKETVQDHKACPNIYTDVSQVSPEEVPRQSLGKYSYGEASDSAWDPFSIYTKCPSGNVNH